MGRIFITGDTHGGEDNGFKKFNTRNFTDGKDLTKDDSVIILGDFGLLWDNKPSKNEIYWLKWLSEKPWKTFFLDGNHENYYRLDNLEQIEMFGNTVGKVSESVYHLKRGLIYDFDGTSIFTFGGAKSMDKDRRTTDVSWWEREEPNYMEMNTGMSNLAKVGNEVDFILTHDCPSRITSHLYSHHSEHYNLTDYFQTIADENDFAGWFFGHHHVETTVCEKYFCLYKKIVEITLM